VNILNTQFSIVSIPYQWALSRSLHVVIFQDGICGRRSLMKGPFSICQKWLKKSLNRSENVLYLSHLIFKLFFPWVPTLKLSDNKYQMSSFYNISYLPIYYLCLRLCLRPWTYAIPPKQRSFTWYFGQKFLSNFKRK